MKNIERLTQKIETKPLFYILAIGLFLRLVAAFTAHGYYAFDDYYCVVDIAWDWTNGINSGNWFVDDYEKNDTLRTIYYPGIIYLLILFSKYLFFLKDPFYQMIAVQVFHAVVSLLIVFYSYKISEIISNKRTALIVGLLMSCMWFFPFLSVRTLIEWFSIIPILSAIYLLYKNDFSSNFKNTVLTGLLFSIAFALRFQTAFILVGILIPLVYKKHFKYILYTGITFVFFTVLLQGVVDFYVCNKPFGKLIEYVNYNIEHSGDYITRPIYDYIIIIPLLFLPPIGLFIFMGSLSAFSFKKLPYLFWSILVFLMFHSIFENKQERFIFTILPIIIIAGTISMTEFLKSPFWQKRKRLISFSWMFFIVANTILLTFMTLNYTKKSKVEMSRFFYENLKTGTVVFENVPEESTNVVPEYYAGKRVKRIDINNKTEYYKIDTALKTKVNIEFVVFEVKPTEKLDENRLSEMKKTLPNLTYVKRIEGGTIDNFRFKLNSILKNFEYEVYSNEIKN